MTAICVLSEGLCFQIVNAVKGACGGAKKSFALAQEHLCASITLDTFANARSRLQCVPAQPCSLIYVSPSRVTLPVDE